MKSSIIKKTVITSFVGAAITLQAMGSAFALSPTVPGMELCMNPGGCPTTPAFEGGGFAPNPPAPKHPSGPNWGGIGGALIGVAIGGAIVNGINKKPKTIYVQPQPTYVQPVNTGNYHINYCLSKFKSYDIGSNTYMSFSGYRKQCISPAM